MNFKDVVKIDKLVLKNSNNAWKAQVQHFMENVNHLATDAECKEVFKALERAERDESNWKASNVYMSNKSVIIRAKRLKVSLMDGDKVRGKSDVQNDCNEIESTSKTDFEKYQQALVQAVKYLDKVENSQVPAAFAAAKQLMDKAQIRAEGAYNAAKSA